MTHIQNSSLSGTHEGILPSNGNIFDHVTSLDSLTILNSQTYAQ
jgi:hypothetical protein